MPQRPAIIGLAAVVIGASAATAASQLSRSEAAALVQRFCKTLIGVGAGYDPNAPGAWPPDRPQVFRPLVTPDLAAMIEAALERSAASQKARGGKPVLGDGVPWKGVQDAASQCRPGSISGPSDHPVIEIHYSYADAPTEGWTDKLVLARLANAWRIDDIHYGGGGGGRLRSVLAEAIKEPIP